MSLKEHIQNKEETIQINKQELQILKQMEKITNSVFELQELIIDYQEWGYNIEDIKPFKENYPFKDSIFSFNPTNHWGDKETNKE